MSVIDRHKHQTCSADTPTPECLLSYIITYCPYLIVALDKTSNQQMGPRSKKRRHSTTPLYWLWDMSSRILLLLVSTLLEAG